MMNISLESAARLSKLVVKDFKEGHSVDITYRDDTRTLAGTYKWDEVKQFVRELAEALDMTLEEPTPEVEPIVLPKDVYDEVERYMKYIYSDENTVEIKRRADAKLWTNCRSDSGMHLATYIASKAGASIDIARVFMKELPYECESDPKWVLKNSKMQYLEKAHLNPSGGWSTKFTADIENAIKFTNRSSAVKFIDTISQVITLRVKEV